jgi:hypothetical protein
MLYQCLFIYTNGTIKLSLKILNRLWYSLLKIHFFDTDYSIYISYPLVTDCAVSVNALKQQSGFQKVS